MTENANHPGLPQIAQDWFDRGGIEQLGRLDCFVVDQGDRQAESTIVMLHGFPSSSLDWRVVADELAGEQRLLMMLAARGIERVHLVAHDMGTSVACELLARREMGLLPVAVESAVFMNGSVFIEQARLTPSQKLLRSPLAKPYTKLASARLFRWQIGKILARPIDDEELDAMWALMRYNDGIRTLPLTIAYVDERYRFYQRWTGPLARLDIPVRVIWGRHDPVAVPAIAQRLADTIPTAGLDWLDDLGHFPMLEAPEEVTAALARFWA